MADLAGFLKELFVGGHVALPMSATFLDPGDAAAILAREDQVVRPELPGEAPLFLPAPGLWAAHRLYEACQATVNREITAEALAQRLGQPCPHAPSPGVCYSVDLTFRFLPDIHEIAMRIASADPLLVALQTLSQDWPLSSVGILGLEIPPESCRPFLEFPCLKQLYVDRILQRNDPGRLNNAGIITEVRTALGAFPGLASPEIRTILASAR